MVLVVLKFLVVLVFVYYGVSFGWVVVRYFGIWMYVVVFRIAGLFDCCVVIVCMLSPDWFAFRFVVVWWCVVFGCLFYVVYDYFCVTTLDCVLVWLCLLF